MFLLHSLAWGLAWFSYTYMISLNFSRPSHDVITTKIFQLPRRGFKIFIDALHTDAYCSGNKCKKKHNYEMFITSHYFRFFNAIYNCRWNTYTGVLAKAIVRAKTQKLRYHSHDTGLWYLILFTILAERAHKPLHYAAWWRPIRAANLSHASHWYTSYAF